MSICSANPDCLDTDFGDWEVGIEGGPAAHTSAAEEHNLDFERTFDLECRSDSEHS